MKRKSLAEELIEKNISTKESFLDLGNCDLTDSSPELKMLSFCPHLKGLSLGSEYFDYNSVRRDTENKGRENSFTTIPPGLPPGIEELQIRNAGIARIDNTRQFQQLKLLDLSLNVITRIENINNLQKLKELALHGNQIEKIEDLEKLERLEILHLTKNLIRRIENLESLKNLWQLLLSGNKINVIEQLDHLKKLIILDLSENNIVKIQGLSGLEGLRWLGLADNGITILENLQDLHQLRTLYVSKNHISVIRGALPASITGLIIGDNFIDNVDALFPLQELVELFIGGNRIKEIQPLLGFKKLSNISLDNNPITDCPADIWQTNDLRQIRAYFETKDLTSQRRALKPETNIRPASKPKTVSSKGTKPVSPVPGVQGGSLSRDVKLILLGNSSTGKTNLVYYLKEGGFLKTRNSTHGLEVTRWYPDPKRFPLLKDIVVNIWDFGGQEYYHEAYRLFLSANAVYLVLWDKESNVNTRRKINITETEEQEIELFEKRYWLDTVRYYGENKDMAPLLLVQNKTDNQEKDKERVSQDFFNLYKLTETHHISLKEGTDKKNTQQGRILDNFERDLEAVLLTAADKAEINESWQLIRQEIINYQEDVAGNNIFRTLDKGNISIDINDFNKACEKLADANDLDLTADDLHTLPRWLDKTGAVVFFENNDELNKQIFINPKRLSAKIYELLTREVLDRKGEFSLSDIKIPDKIEKEKGDKIKSAIIEITKDLGLVFDHPNDKSRYIAPQYLPGEHAIEDLFVIASTNTWQDAFWVKVPLFYYKKLLHHLIIHFSAHSTTARYFWKHGIVFLKHDLKVLIKGQAHENSHGEGVIFIGVQEGDKKKELQKEVFQVIYDYEKNTKKKSTTQLVSYDLKGSSYEPIVQIEEGPFIKNMQLSYDNESYETYERLKALSNGQEQFFINEKTKARLSLHRFSHILPFAVKTRTPKKIFVSYSHQNTSWLNKLRIHLAGLKRSGEVEDWTDQEIMAGEKWDKKIKENMMQADVFICLLSADFVASEYIWNTELAAVFECLKNKSKQVIFIYIEPFDILSLSGSASNEEMTTYAIREFEIIPKDENGHLKAVSLWQNENQALRAVVGKIREAIR